MQETEIGKMGKAQDANQMTIRYACSVELPASCSATKHQRTW